MDEWREGYQVFRDGGAENINWSDEKKAGYKAALNVYIESEREDMEARRDFSRDRGYGSYY